MWLLFVVPLLLGALAIWKFLSRPEEMPVRTAPEGAVFSERPTPPATPDAAEIAAARRAPDVSRPVRIADGSVLLSGFVVDDAGATVANAFLLADRRRRVLASDGEYAIFGLPRGVVAFQVSAPGFQTLDVALDLAAGGELRHDFVLPRSIVIPFQVVDAEGKSLLDGNAIPTEPNAAFSWGTAIVASEELPKLPPTHFANYQSFGIGRVTRRQPSGRVDPRIPEGMDGIVEVPKLPVEVSLLVKHVVVDHHRVDAPGASVRFVVDDAALDRVLATIVGRFVDRESGAPLAGVTVSVGDLQHQGGPIPSDGEGRFRIGPRAPGFLKFQAGKYGPTSLESYRTWLQVDPGTTLDLGDVQLGRGIMLGGEVVGADGKPVKAALQAVRQDLVVHGRPIEFNDFFVCDEAGMFGIPDLGPHRYVITAATEMHGGDLAVVDVDVTGDTPPRVKLQLAKPVDVRFDSDVGPDERLMAEYATASGGSFAAGRFAPSMRRKFAPGSYLLSLYAGGALVRTVPFTVPQTPIVVGFRLHDDEPPVIAAMPPDAAKPGDAAGVDLVPVAPKEVASDRKPGLLVLGVVKDASGAPLASANVSARDAARRGRSAECDAQGRFAIAGLAAGPLDLVARADGCLEATRTVELQEGDPQRVELALERMTRVRIRFTDLAGASLRGELLKRSGDTTPERMLRAVATLDEPGAELDASELSVVSRWRNAGGMTETGDGTLEIEEPLPVHVSVVAGRRVLSTETLAEPAEELALAVDPSLLDESIASARLRLVDATTRAPLTRAGTTMISPDSFTWPPIVDLPADSDGVVTFSRQPAGERTLCVAVEPAASIFLRVVLAPGENDLGELAILRDVTLRGRVLDEGGRPVEGRVSITAAGANDRWTRLADFSVDADADGRFSSRVLSPSLWVQLRGEYASDPVLVDVVQLGDRELTVTARRGVPVTLRPRSTRELRHVTLTRADGAVLLNTTLRSAAPYEMRLRRGAYRVLVEKDGSRRTEQSFTVADAPLAVDLE